jgi:tRNA(fMet)-specific endonuclease VapC
MAFYLLDTTTLTLLRRGHPRVSAAVVAHSGDTVGVTSVNIEEVLTGWYTRIRRARTNAAVAAASVLLAEAVTLLGRFPIFPLTEPALDRYDLLVRLKWNVGGMDLKIAALALELGATVVTNNARDFGRVPGLAWADWSV